MTCQSLLDHRTLPEMVRACVLKAGHKRPHYPGDWRAPTSSESKRLSAARLEGYDRNKGREPVWSEVRVRRFSR